MNDNEKYICYEGENKKWYFMHTVVEEANSEGYYKYSGKFYDGVYGTSVAKEDCIFNTCGEAIAFCDSKM